MFLQYLKKEVSDEVGFLLAVNLEVFYNLMLSFLINLARHVQSAQASLQYLCDISRKKSEIKLIFFCMQVNMKVFYKLILSFLSGVARDVQKTQNNKLAMP